MLLNPRAYGELALNVLFSTIGTLISTVLCLVIVRGLKWIWSGSRDKPLCETRVSRTFDVRIDHQMRTYFRGIVALEKDILAIIDGIGVGPASSCVILLFYTLFAFDLWLAAVAPAKLAIVPYIVLSLLFTSLMFIDSPGREVIFLFWPVIFLAYPFMAKRYPRIGPRLRATLEHCHYHLLFALPSERLVKRNLEYQADYESHLREVRRGLSAFKQKAELERYLGPLLLQIDGLIQNVESWPLDCDPLLQVGISELDIVTDTSEFPERELGE